MVESVVKSEMKRIWKGNGEEGRKRGKEVLKEGRKEGTRKEGSRKEEGR